MDSSYQPSDEESDDGTAAMAAAMGFSNFGTQKPALKKRKFNAATDAFVAGDELANIDKGGKKGQGSGGNQVPLGKTRVIGMRSKPSNEDEIHLEGLDGDETEDAENGPQYMDSSLPPPVENPYWYGDNQYTEIEGAGDGPRYSDTTFRPPEEQRKSDGPAYMDTSLPPPAASANKVANEAREMQARIDSIVNSIQPAPGEESEHRPAKASLPPHDFLGESPLSAGLPPKPSFAQDGNPRGGFSGGGRRGMSDTASVASGSTRGRGQYNAEWYLGYYDHSFNENPWEKLEKSLGLETIGNWVVRPPR